MSREHIYFVYILTSRQRGTLYTGMTNDLIRRVPEHRQGLCSFTSRYRVHRLVWFQDFGDVREAIVAEKLVKRWRRSWKFALIEEQNPDWIDLYPGLVGFEADSPAKISSRPNGVREQDSVPTIAD